MEIFQMFIKKITIIVIALFIVNCAFSQVKFGIKAGVNSASLSDVVEYHADGSSMIQSRTDRMATGFHSGIFSNLSLGNVVSFQPELQFSMQGGKQVGINGVLMPGPNLNYRLGYVQLPLLFEIKFDTINLSVLAGVQFSWNVSQKCIIYHNSGRQETISKSDTYYFDGIKKHDTGLVFGLQYRIIEKISIGVRYNLGLSNNWYYTSYYGKIAKGWKSNVFQIGLGFSF